MGEPVSIPYFLTQDTVTSGFVDIYTVPDGKTLHVNKIHVQFPAGTNAELEVALYYGDMKVSPATDNFAGDDARYEDKIDVKYFSGDLVKIWYNCTKAAAKIANIKLEGVLE